MILSAVVWTLCAAAEDELMLLCVVPAGTVRSGWCEMLPSSALFRLWGKKVYSHRKSGAGLLLACTSDLQLSSVLHSSVKWILQRAAWNIQSCVAAEESGTRCKYECWWLEVNDCRIWIWTQISVWYLCEDGIKCVPAYSVKLSLQKFLDHDLFPLQLILSPSKPHCGNLFLKLHP